jgi:hypothetical protein
LYSKNQFLIKFGGSGVSTITARVNPENHRGAFAKTPQTLTLHRVDRGTIPLFLRGSYAIARGGPTNIGRPIHSGRARLNRPWNEVVRGL